MPERGGGTPTRWLDGAATVNGEDAAPEIYAGSEQVGVGIRRTEWQAMDSACRLVRQPLPDVFAARLTNHKFGIQKDLVGSLVRLFDPLYQQFDELAPKGVERLSNCSERR